MKKYIILLFLIGLILQIFLSLNFEIGGDQEHLLALGERFAETHELEPFAKLKSGGGTNPGFLMQLLIGIPLIIFNDYHSPMILVIIFHIISYILLLKIFRNILGDKGILLVTLIYWMSPLRIYNGGFLWEPAFIFLPAALHFWTAYRSRNNNSLLYSFIHIFSLLLAIQIHNSSMILILSTVLLFAFKKIKLNLYGSLLGFFLGIIFFLPALFALLNGKFPDSSNSEGYLFWSFTHVVPFIKGCFYWFKNGGFDMVRSLKEASLLNNGFDIIRIILQILSGSTVLISIFASIYYFRSFLSKKYKYEYIELDQKDKWIKSFCIYSIISLVISSAMSPITLQGWMTVIILHVCSIPMIYFGLLGMNTLKHFRLLVTIYAFLQIAVILFIGFGQPKFNIMNIHSESNAKVQTNHNLQNSSISNSQ